MEPKNVFDSFVKKITDTLPTNVILIGISLASFGIYKWVFNSKLWLVLGIIFGVLAIVNICYYVGKFIIPCIITLIINNKFKNLVRTSDLRKVQLNQLNRKQKYILVRIFDNDGCGMFLYGQPDIEVLLNKHMIYDGLSGYIMGSDMITGEIGMTRRYFLRPWAKEMIEENYHELEALYNE